MELLDLQTVGEEAGKVGMFEHRSHRGGVFPRVARDETARPFEKRVHRVPVGPLVIVMKVEVRVDDLCGEVGRGLSLPNLGAQATQCVGANQVFDYCAAFGPQSFAGVGDNLFVHGAVGLVDRVAIEVDEFG